MHDPLAMRLVQRASDLRRDFENLLDGHWPSEKPILEGLTLDELHDEIPHLLVNADVVQGANMRVVQPRYGLRFALKPSLKGGVGRPFVAQDFDCNGPIQPCVPGLIHFAHPTRSNRRDDDVRPHVCSVVESHRCGS